MSAPPTTGVDVVAMTDEHAARVLDIYRLGIATGHATFETEPPSWAQFSATRPAAHRYVAVDQAGAVLGWVRGMARCGPHRTPQPDHHLIQ